MSRLEWTLLVSKRPLQRLANQTNSWTSHCRCLRLKRDNWKDSYRSCSNNSLLLNTMQRFLTNASMLLCLCYRNGPQRFFLQASAIINISFVILPTLGLIVLCCHFLHFSGGFGTAVGVVPGSCELFGGALREGGQSAQHPLGRLSLPVGSWLPQQHPSPVSDAVPEPVQVPLLWADPAELLCPHIRILRPDHRNVPCQAQRP